MFTGLFVDLGKSERRENVLHTDVESRARPAELRLLSGKTQAGRPTPRHRRGVILSSCVPRWRYGLVWVHQQFELAILADLQ